MKRLFILIFCLVAMVMCANAQYSRYNSNYRPIENDPYYKSIIEDKDPTSFLNYFVCFGFGIGGGTINPTGNFSHGSFDMDLICMNILFSYKSGSCEDTSCGYNISSSDANSWQIGVLIPIVGFGGEDIIGRKHAWQIYVAPLMGFINSEDVVFDGKFMHENEPYHNCSWWISDNKKTDASCKEYGGALMVRYGCGYLLTKLTNKSFGTTIGFCF